jgi:UDP-glucose 4-epimerase
MKVLLTGAAGFLGRHVVSALRDAGHAVRALELPGANLEPLRRYSDIELYRADLCESGDLTPAFEGVDVLIHLAARLQGEDRERLAVAVQGTERLLEAMARSSTKRLVLASSLSVYDVHRAGGELAESSPLDSEDLEIRDGYAVAKIGQERVTRSYCERYGWQLTVLRPGAIWGEGRLFIHQIGRRLGPFLFVVTPRAGLLLTYVENCARAFVAAAERPEAVGRTFNVVDGHRITRWRYAGKYLRSENARVLRLPVPYWPALSLVRLVEASVRAFSGGRYRPPGILGVRRFEAGFNPVRCSGDALRQVLGWTPQFGFQDALARALSTREEARSVPSGPEAAASP